MERIFGSVIAHGYQFGMKSDHRTDVCTWCAQAKAVALTHMKDATLKTTRSTKIEPDDTPHVVHLTRLGRDWATQGAPAVNPCDLSDDTLRRVFSTTQSNWDRAMIEEVMNLRIKLSRERPVVLDLEEDEAATVLNLLDLEQENQTDEADAHYQNGSGFEADCVQARTLAEEVEKIADRLRSKLANHLDKAYAGELGL